MKRQRRDIFSYSDAEILQADEFEGYSDAEIIEEMDASFDRRFAEQFSREKIESEWKSLREALKKRGWNVDAPTDYYALIQRPKFEGDATAVLAFRRHLSARQLSIEITKAGKAPLRAIRSAYEVGYDTALADVNKDGRSGWRGGRPKSAHEMLQGIVTASEKWEKLHPNAHRQPTARELFDLYIAPTERANRAGFAHFRNTVGGWRKTQKNSFS